ncbi:hypothetical protein SUNI508_10645 [Seiridium unicorne]|uniref:Uncharacterized protein n=1 Tax=Seiridium unicorne TaxID=138068 RepID=A0ABR2UK79_9PEZI
MSSSHTQSTEDLKGKSKETDAAMDWEDYYSEEEKEKLRKKGINPALKAEMDYYTGRSEESKGKGRIWYKIGDTPFGGSWCNGQDSIGSANVVA